jgi:regulator of protease activity HflC (stomatin/prohibitin superfamily)
MKIRGEEEMEENKNERNRKPRLEKLSPYVREHLLGVSVVVVVLIVATSVYGFASWVTVGVGEAVIIVSPLDNSISGPIFGPVAGPLKNPLKMEYATKIYYATDSVSPLIPCFSKDQLEMDIDVTVRWRLNTTKLLDLYSNYPTLNWKEITINRIIEERIRFVTKRFTTVETIEKRDLVAETMKEAISDALTSETSLVGAVKDVEFNLRNINYPQKYTDAIIDKQAAEQRVFQAEFERQRILILANASAQEAVIQAQGLANSKVIVANSTREAIELIVSSSSEQNVTRITELYIYIEGLKEIAKTSKQTILVMGTTKDGIPFIYAVPP